MKRLTQKLKASLADLAHANAGEMLSSRQKARLLGAVPEMPVAASREGRREVILSLGAVLPPRTMRYAIGVCQQLDADLCVLGADAAAIGHMLAPYREARQAAGIECRVEEVAGRGAISRFFDRHPRVVCAIAGGSGDPLGHQFGGRGTTVRGKPPVPIVLVDDEAGEDALPGQQCAVAD